MHNSRLSSYSFNTTGTSRIRKSLATNHSSRVSNITRTASFNSSSHAVEESINHLVENFGIPLPVLVTEAITLDKREVTARLDVSGWAWLVCGRSLFIWKYKLRPEHQLTAAPHCRELTLPPSDVSHKADLVCILPSIDKQVPAVLAVSPEGTIRYWPSITHDGSSIEISAELHGQECFSLTNCQPHGCVLATTTNTLLLVTPSGFGKETSLVCRSLTVSKGVLARISRRMTSFIFGPVPNQNMESRLVRVITNQELTATELYLLSECGVQKWEINSNEGEKLVFNHDIDYVMREKFIEHLWSRELLSPTNVQLWLIDMQLHKNGIVILAGAVNRREPHQMRYAVAVIQSQETIFKDFISFSLISHIDSFQNSDDDFMPSYRLIVPGTHNDNAYIYRNNVILCISLQLGSNETDKIEFHQQDDTILGAGSFNGMPLFLTNKHGIVCVKYRSIDNQSITNSKIDEESVAEIVDQTNVSTTNEDSNIGDDRSSQLKSALLSFCSKNYSQSQILINKHFPPGFESDILLNNSVYALSQKTIDDYPIVDPRWAEAVSQDSAVSSSLIIMHQLGDKQKAHQLLIDFLQQFNLWERLSTVMIKGQQMPTQKVILEHNEKLEAAKSIRNLHAQFGSLIESAIKIILRNRKTKPSGKLTNQDMFYREVSAIQDIIPALIAVEEEHISFGSTQTIANTIQSINRIILNMLWSKTSGGSLQSTNFNVNNASTIELTTWNFGADQSSLRAILIKQHGITLNNGVSSSQDASSRENMLQQVMDLTDLILDGYQRQVQMLQSLIGDSEQYRSFLHQYNQDRSNLIFPLLKLQQYERAASLAEKYFDFEILVNLCETTNNQNRLNRYIIQFADKGFSDFAFNWYLKEGKRGKLLSQTTFQQDNLKQFLKNHSNLSWLNDIHNKRFWDGSRTLKKLGETEKLFFNRKKTLLSMSKLMACASDMSSDEIDEHIQDINEEQNLLLYQEQLPALVLESYGFDVDSMRVLSPIDLIEMYVSEENVHANAYDFRKALDLLHFVRKDSVEEFERLCCRIWSRAILRDDWDNLDDDNDPYETCSKTVFFQTIELVFNDNMNLNELLPDIKVILENEELGSLKDSSKFSYLIQAGYEQVVRLMN